MVGHLLLSPCPVEDDAGAAVATVIAIGPVAVHPAVQRQGIGSALMHAATAVALARGVPALVLLGHADYYPRFGFEPARGVGLAAAGRRLARSRVACPPAAGLGRVDARHGALPGGVRAARLRRCADAVRWRGGRTRLPARVSSRSKEHPQ